MNVRLGQREPHNSGYLLIAAILLQIPANHTSTTGHGLTVRKPPPAAKGKLPRLEIVSDGMRGRQHIFCEWALEMNWS